MGAIVTLQELWVVLGNIGANLHLDALQADRHEWRASLMRLAIEDARQQLGELERQLGEIDPPPAVAALRHDAHEAQVVSDYLTGSSQVPDGLVEYARELQARVEAAEAFKAMAENLYPAAHDAIVAGLS